VHPRRPWNPVKVDEKADRTVVPGNISQAESQKGVLSKSTDTDKNNNNIAVPTQAPKASGAYPKCNGHASKMARQHFRFRFRRCGRLSRTVGKTLSKLKRKLKLKRNCDGDGET